MSISELREFVRTRLVVLAWNKWAQLGVFAPVERPDLRAMDPEALLLFSFEVGRDDPRLFDEVLDWLLTNEKLVSVQRLRNLCADDLDRDLAEAALAWIARQGSRSRSSARPPHRPTGDPVPLFRSARQPVKNPDPSYLGYGFLKPDTEPSGKSATPDLTTAINFAFRMRQLLGVGSRAEVFRYLITAPEAAGAQELAESAGYAKRNVNETLAALTAARGVWMYELGNEHRYSVNRVKWGELLDLKPGTWPIRYEWPRLLLSLRQLARWINNPDLDRLSDYLVSSEARSLMDALEPGLAYAGIVLRSSRPPGDAYWSYFEQTITDVLTMVETAWT